MMKRHVLPLRLSAVADDIVPPRPPVARIIMTGMVITLIGFGGFGAWAALAPLASAAMAPGIITVDSSRKTVQHLDGGIIAEILVRRHTGGTRTHFRRPPLKFGRSGGGDATANHPA
jgi:hypothetical protein